MDLRVGIIIEEQLLFYYFSQLPQIFEFEWRNFCVSGPQRLFTYRQMMRYRVLKNHLHCSFDVCALFPKRISANLIDCQKNVFRAGKLSQFLRMFWKRNKEFGRKMSKHKQLKQREHFK